LDTYILRLTHGRDRNTLPVSTLMFSGVNFSMAPSETLSDETGRQKFKMAAKKTKLNVALIVIIDFALNSAIIKHKLSCSAN